MRILLAHNSLYFPSHGGGDKSNRLLMEALSARGHRVRAVSRLEKFEPQAHYRLIRDLEWRDIRPEFRDQAVRFTLHGVDVYTLTLNPQWRAYFSAHLEEFDPDIIVTSTDDPGLLLFDLARRAPRARLVYLVRATIAVPFGPDSSMISPAKTEMLRHADGIVGVSEYVADYVRKWGGLDATHVPISPMEPGEPENLGRFDNPFVTIVNPCAVKGIDIFVSLAERMPQLQFAAVPTWGTNARDRAALRQQPNIAVLEPVDDIDKLFRQTRVMLVPSVWAEARSRIVMEAMLRGIPVIASDAGGIKEAKLGIPYLVPVNLVTRYEPALDENMVPVAQVPPQDVGPWETALHRLTSDLMHWEEISARSREAALKYAHTLTVEPFERFLLDLPRRPRAFPPAPASPRISDEKKLLIALLFKQRIWFPSIRLADRHKLRLFCFPHAGAGTLAYRSWSGVLKGVAVCPALLPGRETRLGEPALDSMPELIRALTAAIRPFLDVPFAFFGHSMGAGIAFELARSLRRASAPGPKILVVSAARAPQLRVHQPGPEPSDEALMDELQRRHGGNREILELALPALRADTRLYRNYRYEPEPPLSIPIFAYGGDSDPSVRPEHLDGWRDQTTASFTRREFPGGHFYLQTEAAMFLSSLNDDLQAGVTRDS